MSINLVKNLDKFIKACSLLSVDLDHAIDDLNERQLGKKIFYAVDFSEIYVYIFPTEAYGDFVLFPDAFEDTTDEITSAKAIQQIILNFILHKIDPGGIILLPPYLTEFANFITKFKSDIFREFIHDANELYKQFHEITEKNLNDEILILCQKALDGNIREDESEILNAFIANFGIFQSIIGFLDSPSDPLSRLNQLNPQVAFKKLPPELINNQDKLNTEVYIRWIKKFDKVRRKGSITSIIDAAAIQYLFNINQMWKPNNKFVLITRSENMHDIYREEVNSMQGGWDETGSSNLLRHPRAFILELIAVLPGSPYNQDYLINFKEMVNRFLTHCKTYKLGDVSTLFSLQEELVEIQEKWRVLLQFTITLSTSEFLGVKAIGQLTHKAQIIKEVIQNKFYKGKLVNYLENLLLELDQTHEFLRLALQGIQDQFSEIKTHTNHHGVTAISANTIFMPYELYLESVSVVQRLKSLSARRDLTSRDLILFLKESHTYDDYENLLANAYVLGAQSWWHFAETYCRMALTKYCPNENLCNEGMYFLAVCIDQQHSPFRRILEAYNQIRELSERKETRKNSRIQIEKGILILRLHQSLITDQEEIPSLDNGLSLLNYYHDEIKKSPPLWIYTFIIKLEHFYRIKDAKQLTYLKYEWRELEKALYAMESNFKNWPAAIIDAVAWGKWLLFGDELKGAQDQQDLLNLLQYALMEASIENCDKIKTHIKAIEEGVNV